MVTAKVLLLTYGLSVFTALHFFCRHESRAGQLEGICAHSERDSYLLTNVSTFFRFVYVYRCCSPVREMQKLAVEELVRAARFAEPALLVLVARAQPRLGNVRAKQQALAREGIASFVLEGVFGRHAACSYTARFPR